MANFMSSVKANALKTQAHQGLILGFMLLSEMAWGAAQATVHRCGNLYSDRPCAQNTESETSLKTNDARTPEQVQSAQQQIRKDQDLAQSMQAQRQKQERELAHNWGNTAVYAPHSDNIAVETEAPLTRYRKPKAQKKLRTTPNPSSRNTKTAPTKNQPVQQQNLVNNKTQ